MGVDLTDLLPAVKEVDIGRGRVVVNSLDLTHIGILLDLYGEDLKVAFKDDKNPDFTELLKKAPEAATAIISMAIGAEDQVDNVKKIPLSAKIQILVAVWELTVLDPKKFIEEVKDLADRIRSVKEEIKA